MTMNWNTDLYWEESRDILNDVFINDIYYYLYKTSNKAKDILERDHTFYYEIIDNNKEDTYKIKINNKFLNITFFDKQNLIEAINYTLWVLEKLKNYEKKEKIYMAWSILNSLNFDRRNDVFDIKIDTFLVDDLLVSKEDFEKIFWEKNIWKKMKLYMNFLKKVR